MILHRTVNDIKEVLFTYAMHIYCIRYNDNTLEWMTGDRLAECYGESTYEVIRDTAFRGGFIGIWHKLEM